MTDGFSNKERVLGALMIVARDTKKPVSRKEIMPYLDMNIQLVRKQLRLLEKEGAIRKAVIGHKYVLLR